MFKPTIKTVKEIGDTPPAGNVLPQDGTAQTKTAGILLAFGSTAWPEYQIQAGPS